MTTSNQSPVPAEPAWRPARPKFRPLALILAWILSAAALLAAAWIVPGAHVNQLLGRALGDRGDRRPQRGAAADRRRASPAVHARPRPAARARPRRAHAAGRGSVTGGDLSIDSFWSALGVALVAAAVGVVLDVVFGTNDDDTYTYPRHPADRTPLRGSVTRTDAPGIIFLEIDGLALPVLQRAMRDGNAPNMARWLAGRQPRVRRVGDRPLVADGCEPGGDPARLEREHPGLPLGGEGVGEARRVLRAGRLRGDRAHPSTGRGLLANGGASRGNLLSGEADQVILTVSRMDAEKKANPGYRAFFANGFNVVRTLVLFFWEVMLEWTAASRAKRRDVRPRGHRGGIYPLLRAAMCVFVRDLIVYGVLTDMMKGRPAVYATFSSYDEVAHHSGLERADTLEALRKLDQQFGRIDRARRYAARPYEIVVLSDHGQTQGATFKQRNGYGLDDLVERRSRGGAVPGSPAATSRARWSATRSRGDRHEEKRPEERRLRPGGGRARLGQPRARLPDGRAAAADARGDRGAHPELIPALREHPHVGWLLVRSSETAPSRSARGTRYLPTGGSWARIRSRPSRRTPGATSSAPTASRTSRTSWSGASTTRCSTRAARSRS